MPSTATVLLTLLSLAAGAHTALTYAQLLPGGALLGPPSEWGLERYSSFFSGVAACLLLHIGALRLLFRWAEALRSVVLQDAQPLARPASAPPVRRCRAFDSKAAAVGPVLRAQGLHLAVAMISLEFLLFMHGATAAWPLGFALLGGLLLAWLPRGRAGHTVIWAYAAAAVALNHCMQVGNATFVGCGLALQGTAPCVWVME